MSGSGALRRLAWGALFGVAFTTCAAARTGPQPIIVFVSVAPEKYFVDRVGGPRVSVTTMVAPGASPATYEPTPGQLSRLAAAQVYFRIGVDFEAAWMPRIAGANPRMRIVDLRQGIALREAHDHGLPDPHVWTSPPLVKIMAATIRDTLAALDAAHRPDYAARYDAFAADLDRLDHDIRAALEGARTRSFMVFHPAWGYFADTYGLTQIEIETGGKEPGARTLAAVITTGRREQVKAIFVQAQFSRRMAETVAQALGARVIAVDPLAENYLDNLRGVAQQFAEALR